MDEKVDFGLLSTQAMLHEKEDKDSGTLNSLFGVKSQDVSIDSLSHSNTSSIYEPSELGSMSSMDESATEYFGNDSQHLSLEQLREKYKKEFKAAIKDSYKYMMNVDIVESCKFTESELSAFDSDDMNLEGHGLSYKEFAKQYQDLTDWLKAICEQLSQSNPLCLSERYLNQAYHEDFLQKLTRRTQFDEYALQLIKRFPSLKGDIMSKRDYVTGLWTDLEKIVSNNDSGNLINVLKDVELDLSNFESWLVLMNKNLRQLQFQVTNADTNKEKLLEALKAHHTEVQPKSKFVNSVLQMCDNLLSSWKPLPLSVEDRIIAAKNMSKALQHRWESLFIQILEWQLRIEDNYDIKQRWSHDSRSSQECLEESRSDSEDSFTAVTNANLPSIHEDIEENNHTNEPGTMLSHIVKNRCSNKEKAYPNFDIGYSSEGQQSISGLKCKNVLELKKPLCCNIGSDFSDSSGVGLSITTGSCVGKSRNFSNELSGIKISTENVYFRAEEEPESSMPATEDEFSNDEMPLHSFACSGLTRSLDLLSHPLESENCLHISDSAVSDGELLFNYNNSKHNPKEMQRHGPLTKKVGKDRLSEAPVKGSKQFKKCPLKRRFRDGNSFTHNSNDTRCNSKIRKVLSYGNVNEPDTRDQGNPKRIIISMIDLQGNDQIVPGSVDPEDNDVNRFHSEMEVTGDEFGSFADLCMEDGKNRHSTPKAPRNLFYGNTALESDSDVEDFRIMMEDSLKALNFTKNCVAQTVKSSRRILDSIEFLEPLATCQTSIKCLKEIEDAFKSVKGKMFKTLDILQLQSLMRDWVNLESQITHHLESGRQLILSEVDLLQNQMSACENALNSVDLDLVDLNTEALLCIIHCYKDVKEKLLEIENNIKELKKIVAPLSNKRLPSNVSCYGDIALKLEYFSALCHSLIVRSGTFLSSCLEVFETSLKFCNLCQEIIELMKQFERDLGRIVGPDFFSPLPCKLSVNAILCDDVSIWRYICSGKDIWLEMVEKLNNMECLLLDVEITNPVHRALQTKLEMIRLSFKNLEQKKESVTRNHINNGNQSYASAIGYCCKLGRLEDVMIVNPSSNRLFGIAKRVIQVGLPLSAALFLGWVYSKSIGFSRESLDDWGLVLFPSLQHVRGRPPT